MLEKAPIPARDGIGAAPQYLADSRCSIGEMNASKALGCGAAAVRPNEAGVAERISSRVAASYSGEYPSVFTPGARMAGSTGNENAVGGANGIGGTDGSHAP